MRLQNTKTMPLAASCSLLQPLECKWSQVAASGRRGLLEQVAASGCKWPQVVASGRKWPQVAAGASGRKGSLEKVAAWIADTSPDCSSPQNLKKRMKGKSWNERNGRTEGKSWNERKEVTNERKELQQKSSSNKRTVRGEAKGKK